MKRFFYILVLFLFTSFLLRCNSFTSSSYEEIYKKKFGMITVTMCLVKDTSESEMKNIGRDISNGNVWSFVFFYLKREDIKDITQYTDVDEAIPGDGYYAKYRLGYGLEKNIKLYQTNNKVDGPVKIILLESKSCNVKNYRYSYFVRNYTDTKETDQQMITVAKEAKILNGGFTEVFFFNDSINAPKLDKDGFWGNESQNSWNQKFGKYCVGYYYMDSERKSEFTKGWK
jgi:hypothetical protein